METARTCFSCSNPCHCRESLVEPTVHKPPLATTTSCVSAWGCKKGHGVASKLIHGVTDAFFMSLKLCSCVYVDTKGDSEDSGSLPLMIYVNDDKPCKTKGQLIQQ
ncbi:unnamed protein product [Camellia sinensis]